MSDGKGKGRAKTSEDEQTEASTGSASQTLSLIDRVVASATGLGRSTFAAPSRNELSDTAFKALESSGKGESTGRDSGSTRAEESTGHAQPSSSTHYRQNLPSFRGADRADHIQSTEAEFSSFLDGIHSFTPSNVEQEATLTDGISLERVWETVYFGGQVSQQGYTPLEEQQICDGQQVVDLLSNPILTTETMELSSAEEEANWKLTAEQLMVLRGMLNELFPPEEASVDRQTDHPLNLIPDAAYLAGEEGRQMWMEQWDSVLSRYADEVWGGLLPLVKEARDEVQLIRDDDSVTSVDPPKALRRLGLILGHLRIS